MYNDPYDCGTPKYKTAQAIYEGLSSLANCEEMGILSEMFADVSWEGQDYYYFDKGAGLLSKFEEISEYGQKMWLLDLAIFQIDEDEIHDVVYEALINPDLAKRVGFKDIFVEEILKGDKSSFKAVSEEFLAEAQELNRFTSYDMAQALATVMKEQGLHFHVSSYHYFSSNFADKVRKLRLQKETSLITECRALLTSYDDFMYGLRMNQALYQEQEQRFQAKMAALNESYKQRIAQLYAIAESQGVIMNEQAFAKLLEGN